MTGLIALVASPASAVLVPPANDDFANAQVITGASGTAAGDNTGATGQSGEPDHAGASAPLNSIWYSWQSPSTGTATFDTCVTSGTQLDTTLAAYGGTAVDALGPALAANDQACGDGSRIQFAVTSGSTYHIVIDGFGANVGPTVLHWRVPSMPSISSVAPTSGTTAGGTTVTISGTQFSAGATVQFGADAASTVTVVDATTITATSPAHAAGAVDLVVTNPDGGVATSAGAFSYVAPDYATFVNPSPATGLDGAQPFSWTTIAGAQAYYLTVGTTAGGYDDVNSGILAPSTSSYAVGPLGGGQHYARIYTQVGGNWRYQEVTFTVAGTGAGKATFVK